ncbi:sensor histidine kinase [Pantanalinema sp. GBBB05]|uniref:sensor histidine kinase n=1 Tax=Pantanalinema sp. GBBB05 TaxID=2604139 RepID=UPI003D8197A1
MTTVAVLSYRTARELLLDNLRQQALAKIHQGSAEIDQWLAVRKAEVQMLANSPVVQTLDWSQIEPYYRSELRRNSEFHIFSIALTDGWNYNTAKGQTGISIKDREWFINGMAGKVSVANPILSRTTGVVQINVSAPIRLTARPKPVGVVSGAIPINHVLKVVEQLQYGPQSYAFALNSLGVPISHPNAELIGTPEYPAPSFLRSKMPELARLAERMVAHAEGVELVRIDDQWQYVAYVPLKEAGWSIALVIPHENLERHLDALNFLAIVVGALMVVAIVGIWRQVQAYEYARTRAAQEALLNRLTTRIRQSLELTTILQTTVTELASLAPLEQVLFGWDKPEMHGLELLYRSPAAEPAGLFTYDPACDFKSTLASGASVQLYASSEPLQQVLQLRAGHYFALTLPTEQGELGYLIACYPKRLSQADRELLHAVIDQLAIAVRQAELYSQTQTQVELLNQTLVQLQQAQTQLVQSEKMSSLGQLVAGIAHEINNPVNFIYGNLTHTEEYAQDLLRLVQLYQQAGCQLPPALQSQCEAIDLEFLKDDLPKLLASMRVGACRIREIVSSLRVFSRLDEAEVKAVDLHEGIDSTLMLLQNRLQPTSEQAAIEVIKHYGDLPKIECYAGQLNQVLMNLLSNAIEALTERNGRSHPGATTPGRITIWTETKDTQVIIRIADNGPGIPAHIQPRLFDPFFTTKPVGQGTGMGLAISYQIITQQHQGQLHFVSEVGHGTEFIIEIPVHLKSKVD